MKALWKTFKIIATVFVIAAIIFALIAPSLATTGKLRGNKFALNQCKWQTRIWKNAELNATNFDFYKLSDDDKKRVVFMGYKLNFLVKTNFVWGSVSKREIVIICGNEFNNVAKSPWTFFLNYPAHAVGYSDGTTALISPEQFTNLDLEGFVSLQNLATNSEFNVFK